MSEEKKLLRGESHAYWIETLLKASDIYAADILKIDERLSEVEKKLGDQVFKNGLSLMENLQIQENEIRYCIKEVKKISSLEETVEKIIGDIGAIDADLEDVRLKRAKTANNLVSEATARMIYDNDLKDKISRLELRIKQLRDEKRSEI